MPVEDLDEISTAAHLSNDDQAVFDIHDILRAYYKVTIKRFNDNVVVQVVERYYLGDNGPVKYVNPGCIGELSDEELSDLATESYATCLSLALKARKGFGYGRIGARCLAAFFRRVKRPGHSEHYASRIQNHSRQRDLLLDPSDRENFNQPLRNEFRLQ